MHRLVRIRLAYAAAAVAAILVIGLAEHLAAASARLERLEARLELLAITGSLEARRLMAEDRRRHGLAPPVLLADLPLGAPADE